MEFPTFHLRKHQFGVAFVGLQERVASSIDAAIAGLDIVWRESLRCAIQCPDLKVSWILLG